MSQTPYADYLRPDEFETGTLPQPLATNPLAAGVQLGMLGAAAGLGISGVQRALRLKGGNQVPPPVMRTMLIGTLIGSGLGVASSHALNKAQPPRPSPINNWYDLAGKVEGDMHKYSEYNGLRYLTDTPEELEKEAFLVSGGLALGALALKGLGAGMAAYGAYQAAKHTGAAVGSAAGGDWKGGAKHLGHAGLNAMYAVPVAGWAAKGLGMGGKAVAGAAAAGRAAQAGRGVAQAGRATRALSMAHKARHVGTRVGMIPAKAMRFARHPIQRTARWARAGTGIKGKATGAVMAYDFAGAPGLGDPSQIGRSPVGPNSPYFRAKRPGRVMSAVM
jgi:hypothetical protein